MKKVPNGYFVSIAHKNLSDIFVIRKRKLQHFITINKNTWAKYKIDPKDFIIKDVWMKDLLVEEALNEAFPEDFL